MDPLVFILSRVVNIMISGGQLRNTGWSVWMRICSFGGSIFKTRALDASAMLKINELYKKSSRKAITSGNLTQVPDKSIFMKYLLKTLEENDDELLPLSTLFYRIYEPIMNNSATVPQLGIVQGTGDEGGDFIFVKKGF